jgi:hypothetical protein
VTVPSICVALRQQRDLIDQVFFRLDDARFRRSLPCSMRRLQPNPGLKRLLAVKAPWKSGCVNLNPPQPLAQDHQVNLFSCGESVLDEWLNMTCLG